MFNAPDQTKAEYVSLAVSRASITKTIVYDFDFSHVEALLNNLSEKDIETLSTIETPSSRRFIISLRFTGQYSLNLEEDLSRWLNRFRYSCNKGSEVEFDYKFPHSAFINPELCAMAFLTRWMREDGCFGPTLQAFMIKRALIFPELPQYLDKLVIGWRHRGFQTRKEALESMVRNLPTTEEAYQEEAPEFFRILYNCPP